ncbi:hypothetical protein PM082_024711 [Marasmius tenuissimus]|nr:hypothetical protein PM082_024711 [Marasmius tenuissimus]
MARSDALDSPKRRRHILRSPLSTPPERVRAAKRSSVPQTQTGPCVPATPTHAPFSATSDNTAFTLPLPSMSSIPREKLQDLLAPQTAGLSALTSEDNPPSANSFREAIEAET